MCREDFNQIQFADESESYNLIFDLPPDKDDDDGYDHVVYQDHQLLFQSLYCNFCQVLLTLCPKTWNK